MSECRLHGGVMMNRRLLLGGAAGAAVALAAPRQIFATDYDLAILGGKIAAVRREIPVSAGADSIDARGKLVVPGLIDIHVHARDAELPPPEILSTGVTTMVDAGSKGADNVDQIIAIANHAPNR